MKTYWSLEVFFTYLQVLLNTCIPFDVCLLVFTDSRAARNPERSNTTSRDRQSIAIGNQTSHHVQPSLPVQSLRPAPTVVLHGTVVIWWARVSREAPGLSTLSPLNAQKSVP